MTKVGSMDVLSRPELDRMLEEARQAVRDAGLPESAAKRVDLLGFHCHEHGTTTTLVAYRGGLVTVVCRECERAIVVLAIADSIEVIAEVADDQKWN